MKSLFLALVIGATIGSPFCQDTTYTVPCDVCYSVNGIVEVETKDASHEHFQYYGDTMETEVLVKFRTMGTTSIYDDEIIDVY